MNKKLETNVLILGKTGVGKTALFNYIFGAHLMETGAGRPVTGMGLFEETLEINGKLILHLYDSWGLEADKSEPWKALIQEALDKHNVREIKGWFHTIIYCISAKSARVEDFDLEMINTLGKDKNPVMVVLTHCDVVNRQGSIDEMRKVICENTSISQDDIAEVCSEAKNLLGRKRTEAYGKEKIMHQIKANLLGSISGKMPKLLEDMGEDKIEKWYEDCSEIIEKNIGLFNPCSKKNEKKRNAFFDVYAQDIFHDIEEESNTLFHEAYDFYMTFSNAFSGNAMVETKRIQKIPGITHFEMKKGEKITAVAAGTLFFCIPVVGLLGNYAIRERTRAYYREGLKENRKLLRRHLRIYVEMLREELNQINDGFILEGQ